ncbi:MAG: hypothetical protein ABJG42_24120 [Vibrio splendidus]
MDLLNLDELVSAKRTVQLFGENHDVAERTVGQMLKAVDIAKKADDENGESILHDMIDTAASILPTCPREHLERLNIKQLSALIEYSMTSQEAADGEQEQGKLEA